MLKRVTFSGFRMFKNQTTIDFTATKSEILKEYNYTDEEIKEVMEDLNNFKGMND